MSGVLGMMTGALGGSFIDSISNAHNSASQINHNQNIIVTDEKETDVLDILILSELKKNEQIRNNLQLLLKGK